MWWEAIFPRIILAIFVHRKATLFQTCSTRAVRFEAYCNFVAFGYNSGMERMADAWEGEYRNPVISSSYPNEEVVRAKETQKLNQEWRAIIVDDRRSQRSRF